MISQHKNRVQAIKSKFENLNTDSVPLIVTKKSKGQNKQFSPDTSSLICRNESMSSGIDNKENKNTNDQSYTQTTSFLTESDSSSDDIPQPNLSYLYSKTDINRSISDCKKSLSRQSSDPGKKLHRSHAFRCDRSQKLHDSPKRHGSCHGRSESSNFLLKSPEKRLSKDRLRKLGNVLEDRMRKEHFVVGHTINTDSEDMSSPTDSIPDSEVPKHILDQYAKVNKLKKKEFESKQDGMTDSGVSSETENVDEDKSVDKPNKVKKLLNRFEKPAEKQSYPNLEVMNELCASTETMKIERKNPHLTLTDTLKKALKQPLPMGPPPKKPPRTFAIQTITEAPEKPKKDARQMLEKLEQVLKQRETHTSSQCKNIYDVVETNVVTEKPKEIHYLCTEILDITHKTLLPNQNLNDSVTRCLTSLNCAIPSQSMSSLPYTRMSIHSDTNSNSGKMCCSCSSNSLDKTSRRLSTFLGSQPCLKCQSNDEKDRAFKCHLNCNCKDGNSKFFLESEHIYDVPFVKCDSAVRSFRSKNRYGTLSSCKNQSKSMEDLRTDIDEDQKIYDIPCEESRPATPAQEFVTSSPKAEFQKLRQNFEVGFHQEKPVVVAPKPILVNRVKVSKSTENLVEDSKKPTFKKFATERKNRDRMLSLPKKGSQLDVDRENLNRLMSEIYEAVTACNMEDTKPQSFPTDNSTSSDESIKLTRSLTEKRKNYVRRVSSKVAYLENRPTRFRHQTSICSYKSEIIDNPYSTFRSWKSFRTSQQNLNASKMAANLSLSEKRHSTDSKFNLTDSRGNVLSLRDELDSRDDFDDVDEKAGCVDIELPFVPRERGLFNVCILVGLNYMNGEAYVKSVFPSQVQVPPHIENLIFPETLTSGKTEIVDASTTQCYSIVLTDERGDRSYGYCRRVLPEGASTCLPLCYCLIGKYRAPGFYYKVLEELESHHGSSEEEISNILQQLFESDFPDPGESIQITSPVSNNIIRTVTNSDKCKTLPSVKQSEVKSELCRSESEGAKLDFVNNNAVNILVDVGPRLKTIKMPIEPRTQEDSFSILLDTLGAGLLIKVFATMLLERKVVLISDQLSLASQCLSGLQQILYPLVWQQPLISCIGSSLRAAALDAPLPMLAATLICGDDLVLPEKRHFHEGMLLDLTQQNKVLIYQGDETTILPTSSYKTLKTALQMETVKHKDGQTDVKTRNVMISEAFLRFFVDIFGDFWKFFSIGELGDAMGKEDVIFDKDSFTKSATSKQNQYFLEWFVESAMFNHFIQNMAIIYKSRQNQEPSTSYQSKLIDTPLPNYYEIFEERTKVRNKGKNVEKGNYKNAMNKRMKLLKNKLRDLIA